MEISHKTSTEMITGQGSGLFLLSNRKGGYALFGQQSFSHFCGFYCLMPDEWTLFKTVDAIELDVPPSALVNKLYAVERRCGSAVEEYFVFGKTLFYEVKQYRGGLTLDLDMRKVYDDRTNGRVYKIYWEDGSIIVEYTLYSSDAHEKPLETSFLVIRGADCFTLLNQWEPRNYSYDALRKIESRRWIYRALRLTVDGNQRLTFTYGKDKKQTVRDAHAAWHDWGVVRSQLRQSAQSTRSEKDVVWSLASHSLQSLMVSVNQNFNRAGIFAGIPWFFQIWARDELVSLRGLYLSGQFALSKDLLMGHAKRLLEDGRLSNMVPGPGLGSADAVGWLWLRLGGFLQYLEEEKLLWEYFSHEELSWLCERLEKSLEAICDHYVRDGLVHNGSLETWMDTDGGTGDVREGARIEIQCLTLRSIRTLLFLYKLLKHSNGKTWRQFERALTQKTRETMYRQGILGDGADDWTIRPNVFLAAYAYPDLLSKKEWKEVLSTALKALWLPWGGLASIDQNNPLFCSHYSGQDNVSYHRGDSWYWINNLAAIVLHRVDDEYFASNVRAIRQASTREMLWGGAVGHAAELSSAFEQCSYGCLSQAWSAATLLELLHALGG